MPFTPQKLPGFESAPPREKRPAPVDPCARKHKGDVHSEAAFARIQPHIQPLQAKIMEWAERQQDFTLNDVAGAFPNPFHSLSGRLRELFDAGKLVKIGTRKVDGVSVTLYQTRSRYQASYAGPVGLMVR